MPWLETDVPKERARFVLEYEKGGWTMTELCEVFGISRKTGYKLLSRYEEEGLSGLEDRSRAPHSHPNQVSGWTERQLVQYRKQHPTWGSKKIRDALMRRHPRQAWPSRSTVEEIFKRHGLVQARRKRRQATPSGRPLSHAREPNDVWCADFKGWFRTGDRTRCEPLTITDAYSRYAIRCQALIQTRGPAVRECFRRSFREYGLPRRIRTNNGPPFASVGLGGLTRLSLWWLHLGIVPERIEPGKPQQNGRHERFHRTLKQDAISPPRPTPRGQQRAFTRFLREYNQERPHEALDGQRPSDLYQPSSRRLPRRVPDFNYGLVDEVRRTRVSGHIKWRGRSYFLGEAFRGEDVGLTALGDASWLIQIGPLDLAILNERSRTILPLDLVRRGRRG